MLSTENQISICVSQKIDVLISAAYLLHNIDVKRGTFTFIKTSRQKLSSATFIDGRSSLILGTHVELSIEDCLKWQSSQSNTKSNKYIFHMSFCGSTLMSRVFDIEEKVFSYKEPQILMQLAQLKAANNSYYRNKITWKSLLNFVLGQFNKDWLLKEQNIIKPSSWNNSLLLELLFDGGASRAVFLTIQAEDFLTAVFRGGAERIQYVYSLLKHLNITFPEYSNIIRQVENSTLDSVDLFARLSLITHAIQLKAFHRASYRLDQNNKVYCDFSELLSNRKQCLNKAANTLQLGLSSNELDVSIIKNFKMHAKITDRSIHQSKIDEVNKQVVNNYQTNFSEALKWAEDGLNATRFA